MPVSLAELEEIQSELLADDVAIPADAAGDWSDEEARVFFESGGRRRPVARRLRTLEALLAEADMPDLAQERAPLRGETLGGLVRRFATDCPADGRRALLRRLKRCGMSALGERQRVANALTKAWREGRVAPPVALPPAPLEPPVVLWQQCVAAIGSLRALPPGEIEQRLGCVSLAAEVAEFMSTAANGAASAADAEAARRMPPELLGEVLEALGWSLDATSLLIEGCGLALPRAAGGGANGAAGGPESAGGGLRPRLGQPIAFWTNSMCERGTEVAVYDYADCAERHLGATAWVLYPRGGGLAAPRAKFGGRFGERFVGVGWDRVGDFLTSRGISDLYLIKEGTRFVPDVRELPPSVRALVHCVFHAEQPHGAVYAKISPCVVGAAPVVPHIVRPRDAFGPDMRNELGIPADATVFGRHGGWDTFSIEYAREAVLEVARARDDIWFLFLNTFPLDEQLPNILYLERTCDASEVSRFIRTCDAMLHARGGGETFGLACAEFSASGRPVLASSEHDDAGAGSHHLDVLRSARLERFFYSSRESLVRLLLRFDRAARADYNAYRGFEPAPVMAIFEKVFLGAPPAPAPLVDPAGAGTRPCVDGADGEAQFCACAEDL